MKSGLKHRWKDWQPLTSAWYFNFANWQKVCQVLKENHAYLRLSNISVIPALSASSSILNLASSWSNFLKWRSTCLLDEAKINSIHFWNTNIYILNLRLVKYYPSSNFVPRSTKHNNAQKRSFWSPPLPSLSKDTAVNTKIAQAELQDASFQKERWRKLGGALVMQTQRGRERTVHDMDSSRNWAALGKLQVLN